MAAAPMLPAFATSLRAVLQLSTEPLHLLCSGPAGSIPDIVARLVAEQLTAQQARRVIVDNRPGAAGQIAVGALKSGPLDGSTMLLAQGAVATVNPYLYPKLGYDPTLDLQPVCPASEMTLALAVGPAVPEAVHDLPALLDWMRRNPNLANVGSPGSGTLPHLLEAMLFHAADVRWQHLAYPGGPPAIVALMGGHIAALVLPEGLFRQHKASGRLRILATSGSTRSDYFPDVASLVEFGHPDLVVREWFAFFMAAHVPSATIEAMSQALRIALSTPALDTAFAESGMRAVSSDPAQLTARIAAEQRYWQPVIAGLGLRAE